MIEIAADNTGRISSDWIGDRRLEADAARRALIDQDHDVVIDQISHRDIRLAVAIEIAERERVRV